MQVLTKRAAELIPYIPSDYWFYNGHTFIIRFTHKTSRQNFIFVGVPKNVKAVNLQLFSPKNINGGGKSIEMNKETLLYLNRVLKSKSVLVTNEYLWILRSLLVEINNNNS